MSAPSASRLVGTVTDRILVTAAKVMAACFLRNFDSPLRLRLRKLLLHLRRKSAVNILAIQRLPLKIG
jgi:hypothetical protein